MDKPDLSAYYTACDMAAKVGHAFDFFRSNPAIRGVTDTNTVLHGRLCEQEIMENHRHLFPWLDTFRRVDNFGMPLLYRFPYIGLFNPTTLRHIVTLANIASWLDKPPHNVYEIGGGYGNLAALMLMYWPIGNYQLVEMDKVQGLTRLFLQLLGLDFRYTGIGPRYTAKHFTEVDLAISCYALSELDESEQEWYIANVLVHARAGFLVMNSCKNGYPRETMIARLQAELDTEVICEREIPQTHKDNYTLKWRKNDGQ